MVFVRVSETYDLSTKVGKMGIVGIHTPKGNLITRHYGGLAQNFKYAKFVSCSVHAGKTSYAERKTAGKPPLVRTQLHQGIS